MTGQIIQMPSDEHRDIQALLPWFLTGKLDQAERGRIQAHINDCVQCRTELETERRLAQRITEVPARADAPDVERGWKLMSHTLDRFDRDASPSWVVRLRESMSWLGVAVAVQFCLLATLGFALWRAEHSPDYHALGSVQSGADANIVVVFRPETLERDLRAILKSSGARLVGGPTVSDAYLLRVAPATRAATVARLRQEREVVLAEPVDGG
jgi:hypothetical protein